MKFHRTRLEIDFLLTKLFNLFLTWSHLHNLFYYTILQSHIKTSTGNISSETISLVFERYLHWKMKLIKIRNMLNIKKFYIEHKKVISLWLVNVNWKGENFCKVWIRLWILSIIKVKFMIGFCWVIYHHHLVPFLSIIIFYCVPDDEN